MSPKDSKKSTKGAHIMASGEEIPEMALRILDAAMALFATKGYSATSVREIVQAADVTNPMLYYYFENKEGLFHRLINLLFEDMQHRVDVALKDFAPQGFRAQLREVIRLHIEAAQQSPVALQFIYAVLFGPRDSYPDFDPIAKRAPSILQLLKVFKKAEENGSFTPHTGFTHEFLTMQFFGMLNQHLLLVLVEESHAECSSQHIIRPFIHPRLGDEMIDHLMNFFIRGAGTLQDATS